MLALLEAGPHHEAELVEYLGAGVKRTLWSLRRDGHVKRMGTESKWALASYVAPIGRPVRARPPAPIAAAAPEPVIVDDELEDDADADVDEEELDDAPESFQRTPARTAKGLRQPHERPPSVNVPIGTEPSWWVGASREKFSEEARARREAMRSSKMNNYVPVRMLQ